MSAIGASWSGSNVQLVSERRLVHVRGLYARLVGEERADVRGRGRLDREGGRGRRAAARGGRVDRRDGVRRVRRPPSARRASASSPRRPTRSGRSSILARERGALRACGADLAAHCINDVLTCGADPLFFLDYVAANRIELETVAELVEGAAEVCREAGVRSDRRRDGGAPGHLPRGRARLRRARASGSSSATGVIDGSRVEAGDAVVGLAVRGRARERLHARAPRARGRGLRRRRPARADAALPRRRAAPARPRRTRSRT